MIRFIGDAAVTSLLREVCTTPKPGLVDRRGSGSHSDMNIATFFRSAAALAPYFHRAAACGAGWDGELPALFRCIRGLGIRAEQDMFAATGGVNTHKGLIFSEGILAAAAGYAWTHCRTLDPAALFRLASDMASPALEADFSSMDPARPRSHGEKLFFLYGCRGIRGEVLDGFPSVRTTALPALDAFDAEGRDPNDACVQTLLLLMAGLSDTNVLYRSGPAGLDYVRRSASEVLALGGAFSAEGRSALLRLSAGFQRRHISPGGSADLLAVSLMIHVLQGNRTLTHQNTGFTFERDTILQKMALIEKYR